MPSEGAAASEQPAEEQEELAAADLPRTKRTVPQTVRDRFTCRTCGALCIGYARLEGHYRKNPTHRRHSESGLRSEGAPRRRLSFVNVTGLLDWRNENGLVLKRSYRLGVCLLCATNKLWNCIRVVPSTALVSQVCSQCRSRRAHICVPGKLHLWHRGAPIGALGDRLCLSSAVEFPTRGRRPMLSGKCAARIAAALEPRSLYILRSNGPMAPDCPATPCMCSLVCQCASGDTFVCQPCPVLRYTDDIYWYQFVGHPGSPPLTQCLCVTAAGRRMGRPPRQPDYGGRLPVKRPRLEVSSLPHRAAGVATRQQKLRNSSGE